MPKRKAMFDPSGRADKMRVRPDLNKPILDRLYTRATRPEDAGYLAHLKVIVLSEASSTNCVATTAQGLRCGKSITDRTFAEAMRLTNDLSSDAIENEHTLLAIAQLVCCKQAKLNHSQQASATVWRWKEEAQGAEEKATKASFARLAGEYQETRARGLGEELRVVETAREVFEEVVRGSPTPEPWRWVDEDQEAKPPVPSVSYGQAIPRSYGQASPKCGHQSKHHMCHACRQFYD